MSVNNTVVILQACPILNRAWVQRALIILQNMEEHVLWTGFILNSFQDPNADLPLISGSSSWTRGGERETIDWGGERK